MNRKDMHFAVDSSARERIGLWPSAPIDRMRRCRMTCILQLCVLQLCILQLFCRDVEYPVTFDIPKHEVLSVGGGSGRALAERAALYREALYCALLQPLPVASFHAAAGMRAGRSLRSKKDILVPDVKVGQSWCGIPVIQSKAFRYIYKSLFHLLVHSPLVL